MLGFDQSFLTDEHLSSLEMFVPLLHSAEKQALSTTLQLIPTSNFWQDRFLPVHFIDIAGLLSSETSGCQATIMNQKPLTCNRLIPSPFRGTSYMWSVGPVEVG